MGKGEVPAPLPQTRVPLPERCLRSGIRGDKAKRYAPPPMRRASCDPVDVAELSNETQWQIDELVEIVKTSRPPPPPEPMFPRRSVLRCKRQRTRWNSDEDKLLVLLRENGMGFDQIWHDFLPWRGFKAVSKRFSRLRLAMENTAAGSR